VNPVVAAAAAAAAALTLIHVQDEPRSLTLLQLLQTTRGQVEIGLSAVSLLAMTPFL
jgi:hypothetical protein